MSLARTLLASALLLSLSACAATVSPRAEAIPEGAAATAPVASAATPRDGWSRSAR
jgi:hypothetical protein